MMIDMDFLMRSLMAAVRVGELLRRSLNVVYLVMMKVIPLKFFPDYEGLL